MNCAFCGKEIPFPSQAVLEQGLTEDLTALYHPRCFEKKERRMAGKSGKLLVRHDHGVVSKPGVGD